MRSALSGAVPGLALPGSSFPRSASDMESHGRGGLSGSGLPERFRNSESVTCLIFTPLFAVGLVETTFYHKATYICPSANA